MTKTRPKKSDIPDGVGLLISDVVQYLQRKGYIITAQQIRQYEERDGLFKSIRTKGNYREYTSSLLNTIEFIWRLEIVGFSKQWIKNFFALRQQIEQCPSVMTSQVWDEAIGEYVFVHKRSVEAQEGSTDHIKLQMLVDRFTGMCGEIKERFESMVKIMDLGIKNIEVKQKRMQKLMG